MVDQSAEIIDGKNLMDMLVGLIGSQRVCRMEIPNTVYSWITLLLDIQKNGDSFSLFIDKVAGFEKALSRSPDQEVSIEFLEKDSVPCQFKTRVIECQPKAIWAELPKFIYRQQRRRFFRVRARLGTEIVFHLKRGNEERSKVRDYSLGGVSFLIDRPLEISIGDELTKIDLRILQEDRWVTFHIPRAVVRRVGKDFQDKNLCALEFLEISEETKELLWHHIFKEQRILLQKTKKG